MNPELILSIIPFLKSEDLIMPLIKESGYDLRVCQAGISKLKSKDNIFFVIGKTDFNTAVCQEAFSSMTEKEIMKIVVESNFSHRICLGVVAGLKNEANLMKVLKGTIFNYNLCLVVARQLKSNANLMKIAVETDYHPKVCAEIVQYMTSEKDVIKIMKQTKYDDDVCELGAAQIDFGAKTEDEIIKIFKEVSYDIHICKVGIKFLSSEDKIITTVMKTRGNAMIYEPTIVRLNLKSKSIDELLDILDRVDYLWYFCNTIIPLFKFEEKSDEEIVEIMRKSGYELKVCQAGIVSLKSKKTALLILKKLGSYIPAHLEVIRNFELSIADIRRVIKTTNYDKDICLSLLKNFKLPEKDVLLIIKNVESNSDIYQLAVKSLLEKKSNKQILKIIDQI